MGTKSEPILDGIFTSFYRSYLGFWYKLFVCHTFRTDFVPYLFRGPIYVEIQFNYSIVTIMVGKLMWWDLTNNQMPPAKRTKDPLPLTT